MTSAIQIPDKYKLILLGSLLIGCISTIFLPYNSFQMGVSSPHISPDRSFKNHCSSLDIKYYSKCKSSVAQNTNQLTAEETKQEEDCNILREDVKDCQLALTSAYRKINLSGCLKHSLELQMCLENMCEDGNSGDSSHDGSEDSASGDNSKIAGDAGGCRRMCADKKKRLNECQDGFVMKEFRRYGLGDEVLNLS